jgi:hypothetical protein
MLTIIAKSGIECESKGERAARLYPDVTFDYALPQSWVDKMTELGHKNVAGNFVWIYSGEGMMGEPGPISDEGIQMLARASLAI